jgi:hypothetical protein
MIAGNQSETEKPAGNEGEVRPSVNMDGKLEDKISDEKDDELANENAAEERRSNS